MHVVMAVMQIGVMRMLVPHRFMPMGMGVRLAEGIVRAVRMAVMLVMSVTMPVRHHLMDVLVLMMLRQMQIESNAHQGRSRDENAGQWLGE